MSSTASCSACCGIYNLRFSQTQLNDWLAENTKQFLSLNIEDANAIVEFRRQREAASLPYRFREDIYVCPFTGYIDPEKKRTGCLLHPVGSPHPQIRKLAHPQNFSFYGESICQTYDCLSKERRLADILPQTPESALYGRLVSRADILGLLSEAARRDGQFSVSAWLNEHHTQLSALPSTSFEPPIVPEKSANPLADLIALLEQGISN